MIRVEEDDTIGACRRLARRGFLFGGSTGTVVSGAADWLDRHGRDGLTAVAIAPDLGERYLETDDWVTEHYRERPSRRTHARRSRRRHLNGCSPLSLPLAPARWPPPGSQRLTRTRSSPAWAIRDF